MHRKLVSMSISNGVYDFLKYLAQIGLPAFATFYFAVAQIWGLPNSTEVVGTITSVDAFLGVLLGISSTAYQKGSASYDGVANVMDTPEGKKIFQLEFGDTPVDLDTKTQIVFKVNKAS